MFDHERRNEIFGEHLGSSIGSRRSGGMASSAQFPLRSTENRGDDACCLDAGQALVQTLEGETQLLVVDA